MTPPVADDAHLSIGEVLAELRDEFPDITISKIRFLESQGLVNPERTPSGYRKFYDADLVRLRWILHQQKEHFLPLKVIKERLDALPPGGEAMLLDPEPATPPAGDDAPPAPSVPAPEPAAPAPPAPVAAPGPAAAAPRRPPVRRRAPAFAPDLPADAGGGDDALVAEHSGDGYTRADLARDAGLEPAQVAELESYGLIAPVRESGGDAEFDADALEIAKVAAGFFSPRRRGPSPAHVPQRGRARGRAVRPGAAAVRAPTKPGSPGAHAGGAGRALRTGSAAAPGAVARGGAGLARRVNPEPGTAPGTAPVTPPAVLLDEAQLAECARRLAGEIAHDHPDGVVLVGVLEGALLLLADLARALARVAPALDVTVDAIAISRYAPDSGRVRILYDVALPLEGRDVILVEDLVDTGLSIGYLLGHLRSRGPRTLDVCTLLDRSARRILPVELRYVGVEIPDVYVLGYGLHHADRYRNLRSVYVADADVVHADPDAYVPLLYGGG